MMWGYSESGSFDEKTGISVKEIRGDPPFTEEEKEQVRKFWSVWSDTEVEELPNGVLKITTRHGKAG